MNYIKSRHIIYIAIALLGASFLGYFSQAVQIGSFVFFTLICLILGLWKREFALYLVFLELALGSFGYLLSLHIGGLNLSLRYAFFAIVMGLWVYDQLKAAVIPAKAGIQTFFSGSRIKCGMTEGTYGMTIGLAIFLIIWVFGIIQGYLRGYNPADIFFDANSYIYLLLFLPALKYINTKDKLNDLLKAILIGAAAGALLTFILFIIFTRVESAGFLETLYKWIRDFRIGEITPLKGGAYRIFLQSQIYIIVGLFLAGAGYFFKKINFAKFLFLTALFSGAIYLSLSRSFWIGTLVGLLTIFLSLLYLKTDNKKILSFGITFAASAIVGIMIAGILSPQADILKNRFQIGRAANDTRLSELKVLLPAIKNNFIFGYGFGKTMSFKSFDPRAGEALYTTYAFEWGYLDMVLKFGLAGLAAYLYFIWTIILALFKSFKKEPINILALSVLAALLAVHIFTPYLNHPLGIGILILAGVAAQIDKNNKE
ncbi:MAG: O-antigen ligase family protein [bacterium]